MLIILLIVAAEQVVKLMGPSDRRDPLKRYITDSELGLLNLEQMRQSMTFINENLNKLY